MARRATATERGVRRLAAQLGLPAHILAAEEEEQKEQVKSSGAGEADAEAERKDSIEEKLSEVDDEEEDDPGELSMGLGVSDSASEEISSDLSLPHSFGQYDELRPLRRGISSFDDHLIMTSQSTQQKPLGMSGGTSRAMDPSSEAMMKRFYEVQVGRIRSQLVLSTQSQRELEKTLQQERADAKKRMEQLENQHVSEMNALKSENERLRRDSEELTRRLHMEKTHLSNLQISDALAEQLSRQHDEDLSMREYTQLIVHRRVRALELELETCRHDLERAHKLAQTSKEEVVIAAEDIARLKERADANGRRHQHEIEVADATRKELESQVAALYSEINTMKEERERDEQLYKNQRELKSALGLAQSELLAMKQDHDNLNAHCEDLNAKMAECKQTVALLTADKSFLQNSKTQLEEEVAKLRVVQRDLTSKLESLQEKFDSSYDQSLMLQSETRLQFEKRLDEEMRKFMDVSKQEIERIRNNGQVVYERENRMLKEARDDALKQVETLEARLHTVQSRLDEMILGSTRLESQHTTGLASVRNDLKMKQFELNQLQLSLEEKTTELRNARLEIEMLEEKLNIHKEEFARLETTSSTTIAQLNAALDLEKTKLKEYELLEVDLDNAILQTGSVLGADDAAGANSSLAQSKLDEAVATFGSIPSTSKRRFEQSVQLAQKVVKYQREVLSLEAKLNNANEERSLLNEEIAQLKTRLAHFHQPQSYLIDKLSRKDGELQALSHHNAELEERVENLRQEYQRAVDARNSLQRQVQQLLANREDFDALKTSVQLLRTRLLHATRTAHSGDRSAQSSTTNIDHRSTQSTFAQINDQKTSAMSSPKPSIIAKMTQSPGAAPDGSNLAEAVTLQDKSSGPHWYSKLRS